MAWHHNSMTPVCVNRSIQCSIKFKPQSPWWWVAAVKYITGVIQTSHTLLWLGNGRFYQYPSGWQWVSRMTAPVPVKQPWTIWINWPGSTRWYNHDNIKHNKTMQTTYNVNTIHLAVPIWIFCLFFTLTNRPYENLCAGSRCQGPG